MDVVKLVDKIRTQFKVENDFLENPIDTNLSVIPPYRGKGEIKLIVIGQDPTVKNDKSRSKIRVTLNLDVENSLRKYIDKICGEMGITIDNVYATNMYKYFYTIPPATTRSVLKAHLKPNLELLQQELLEFNDATIITLGEPILQLLTHDKMKVREYWDYDLKTRRTNGIFKLSSANENKLERNFYPFPHQTSIRKEFYKNTIETYTEWLKTEINSKF